MANKKSILDKINFLLSIAKNGNCTEDEMNEVVNLVPEHTDDMIIGRVFGYSVSDYAIATMKWIGRTKECDNALSELSEGRKADIQKLIASKIYLEY